jgi:hypothetical protein
VDSVKVAVRHHTQHAQVCASLVATERSLCAYVCVCMCACACVCVCVCVLALQSICHSFALEAGGPASNAADSAKKAEPARGSAAAYGRRHRRVLTPVCACECACACACVCTCQYDLIARRMRCASAVRSPSASTWRRCGGGVRSCIRALGVTRSTLISGPWSCVYSCLCL